MKQVPEFFEFIAKLCEMTIRYEHSLPNEEEAKKNVIQNLNRYIILLLFEKILCISFLLFLLTFQILFLFICLFICFRTFNFLVHDAKQVISSHHLEKAPQSKEKIQKSLEDFITFFNKLKEDLENRIQEDAKFYPLYFEESPMFTYEISNLHVCIIQEIIAL